MSYRSLTDAPLAAPPFKSYRYRGRYGWIMIGAMDEDDALRQACRSVESDLPVVKTNLQRWNGEIYEPC